MCNNGIKGASIAVTYRCSRLGIRTKHATKLAAQVAGATFNLTPTTPQKWSIEMSVLTSAFLGLAKCRHAMRSFSVFASSAHIVKAKVMMSTPIFSPMSMVSPHPLHRNISGISVLTVPVLPIVSRGFGGDSKNGQREDNYEQTSNAKLLASGKNGMSLCAEKM